MLETVQKKIKFNQATEEPSGVQILQWKEQHNRPILMEVNEFKNNERRLLCGTNLCNFKVFKVFCAVYVNGHKQASRG